MHVGSKPMTTYTNPPPVPYVPPYQPRADTRAATNSRPTQQGTRRPPKTLAPIPIVASPSTGTKTGEIILLKPLEPPYPRSYDPNARYNQIQMVVEDKEKTTFITTWGTFYYKVMPFGLKNSRATYHRAMVTLFHDMMHKEVEVYVDHMIAKLRTPDQHVEDLRKLFERLQKYRLKLNPAKCTFEVKTGNLLGFIANERGIEVDPDKVKAI
ncbi:Retrovirus-related Pol polyprotein from transposon 17.6, partial [Mucuna pruriens]